MADEKEKENSSKKCVQTGVTLKRAKQYYRNGNYFINKNAFKVWQKKQLDEAKAKDEEAKAAEAEEPKAEETSGETEKAPGEIRSAQWNFDR